LHFASIFRTLSFSMDFLVHPIHTIFSSAALCLIDPRAAVSGRAPGNPEARPRELQ